MSNRFKGQGAGKGDKNRVSSFNVYQNGMEKIYARKSWEFWATWEGLNVDEINFDVSGLSQGEKISYKEYYSRLKNSDKNGSTS